MLHEISYGIRGAGVFVVGYELLAVGLWLSVV